ncbi:hypothetical protein EVAR_97729_1 [Eumeta japonica]|uniref:Uncharacterized protein n=1 Tax=Eumeta variegata TaxID=151549 RepID=A0A4C1SHL7_EUMVA|nr:hypothetical protein EVAR_97729_1 [Eumeta japonica]
MIAELARFAAGVTLKKCTLGNVTMSHQTERPASMLASLSHSTMIGLPRAREWCSLQMYCKLLRLSSRKPALDFLHSRLGVQSLAVCGQNDGQLSVFRLIYCKMTFKVAARYNYDGCTIPMQFIDEIRSHI